MTKANWSTPTTIENSICEIQVHSYVSIDT